MYCTTNVYKASSYSYGYSASCGVWFLHESLRGQVLDDDCDRLGDVQLVCLEVNLWAQWGLVRCRNTGKFLQMQDIGVSMHAGNGCRDRTFDLPSPSFLVQAFGITFFNNRQWCVNENLYECQRCLLVQLSNECAIRYIRGDKSSDRDCASVCEKLCHLSYILRQPEVQVTWLTWRTADLAGPSNILVPRLFVEPEVLVQSEPDVITIEPVRKLAQVQQVLF